MPEDPTLSSLLSRWQELRRQGTSLSAEELCPDRPEFVPELRRRIQALAAVDSILKIQKRPEHVETQVEADVRQLLRSRLLLLVALNLFISAIGLVLMLSHPVHSVPNGAIDLAIQIASSLAPWVLLLVLVRGRSLSLRQLRIIEVAAFALASFLLAAAQYRWYHSGWLQVLLKEGKERELIMLASGSMTSPWILLIIVYGTCIPNTGRRCAVVVGAIALVPMLMTLRLGLEDAVLGEFLLRDVLVANMFVWLSFASAIAVYGSHRLAVLRREVQAARRLGQYRLLRRLGAGGMGEVYLAEHQLLRRPCAIKLIRPDRAGEINLQRFEREVHAMAALKHWNTVEIYDYGHADDGTFYYVMEYLPGLSLEQLVERHGCLPPARTLHLLRQVCAALHEAHAVGLIHRDIKPSNIIVCERGGVFDVCKLLDFGLVKVVSAKGDAQLTGEGCLIGTPLYMAPEQATGDGQLDGRCDIYSLGAVAYFLLTGRPVFLRETVMRVLGALLTDPVPPLKALRPDVSDSLQAVVLRCLEKSPDRRYADIASLTRAFGECDSGPAWTQAQAAAWWQTKFSNNDGGSVSPDASTLVK
jgi:serine/threonine-protein kinase